MRFSPILSLTVALAAASPDAANWPQFRGRAGSGVASPTDKPPVEFGPGKKMLWKAPLPSGHGSPSIWADRIFVTAFDKDTQKLETLALDRPSGKLLWRRAAPAEGIEKVHEISSPATSTPAVDGERVYVYFGSCGLFAYDLDGNPAWSIPMPVASIAFGSGASPIVHGGMVILSRDEGKDPQLMLVEGRSGKIIWKQPQWSGRFPRPFSHATPAVWNEEIILHRSFEVIGFDLKTGARRWWLTTPTQGNGTPAVGADAIYVGTWMSVGEPDLVVPLPAFDTITAKYDKDGDAAFSEEEFPTDIPYTRRIDLDGVTGAAMTLGKWAHKSFDANKDGKLDKAEWDKMVEGFGKSRRDHGLIAIKPGGEGDVSASAVLWRETRGVPEIPTPLLYNGKVYAITNGGIVSVMEAKTGAMVYRGRLGAGGGYFASPVAADGRIYFASAEGVVTVIRDSGELDVLARNPLGDPIYATPAIVDSKIYVRTTTHLYAFGE